jgi:hypothetical protein
MERMSGKRAGMGLGMAKVDHGFTFLRDAGHRMMQGWY